jgi:outer membrane protein assembly factor BamE
MRQAFFLLNTLSLLLLSNCAHYDFSNRTVQQGNILSPKVVDRLQLGMTKEDVAILLGTSLISPTFNNDRWDYAYTKRKGSTSNTVRHISLYFVNNRLARIE